jgi:hypothetical protein
VRRTSDNAETPSPRSRHRPVRDSPSPRVLTASTPLSPRSRLVSAGFTEEEEKAISAVPSLPLDDGGASSEDAGGLSAFVPPVLSRSSSDLASLSPSASASSSVSWRAVLQIANLSNVDDQRVALRHAALTLHAALINAENLVRSHSRSLRTHEACARGDECVSFLVDKGFSESRAKALASLRELEWRGLIAHAQFEYTVHDNDYLYRFAPLEVDRIVRPFIGEDDVSRLEVLVKGLDGVLLTMSNARRGVARAERTWLMKTYADCFVGRDAVTWLVERGIVLSRRAAVALGRAMQIDNKLRHVADAHDFDDRPLFYVFVESEPKAASPLSPAPLRSGSDSGSTTAFTDESVSPRHAETSPVPPRAQSPPAPLSSLPRRFTGGIDERARSVSLAAPKPPTSESLQTLLSRRDDSALPTRAPPPTGVGAAAPPDVARVDLGRAADCRARGTAAQFCGRARRARRGV